MFQGASAQIDTFLPSTFYLNPDWDSTPQGTVLSPLVQEHLKKGGKIRIKDYSPWVETFIHSASHWKWKPLIYFLCADIVRKLDCVCVCVCVFQGDLELLCFSNLSEVYGWDVSFAESKVWTASLILKSQGAFCFSKAHRIADSVWFVYQMDFLFSQLCSVLSVKKHGSNVQVKSRQHKVLPKIEPLFQVKWCPVVVLPTLMSLFLLSSHFPYHLDIILPPLSSLLTLLIKNGAH